MMAAGRREDRGRADPRHALESCPTAGTRPRGRRRRPSDLSGQWDVRIEYVANTSTHTLHLKQTGNRLEGTHQGDFVSRDLAGTIDGNSVQIVSSYTERHGDALSFRFTGTVAGDEMSGTLDMGEYLTAKWSAKTARLPARIDAMRLKATYAAGVVSALTARCDRPASRRSRSTTCC